MIPGLTRNEWNGACRKPADRVSADFVQAYWAECPGFTSSGEPVYRPASSEVSRAARLAAKTPMPLPRLFSKGCFAAAYCDPTSLGGDVAGRRRPLILRAPMSWGVSPHDWIQLTAVRAVDNTSLELSLMSASEVKSGTPAESACQRMISKCPISRRCRPFTAASARRSRNRCRSRS